MTSKRQEQIEKIAESLLKDTGFYKIPVKVFDLAEKKGLNVIGHDLGSDIYGILVLKEGKPTIGYNKSNSNVRKRFTVAHELGHLFLGHSGEGIKIDTYSKNYGQDEMVRAFLRDKNSSTGEFLEEREANAFAAALLMPKELLLDKLDEYRFTETEIISKLAKDFDVSTQAMAFRLSNLGILENVLPF